MVRRHKKHAITKAQRVSASNARVRGEQIALPASTQEQGLHNQDLSQTLEVCTAVKGANYANHDDLNETPKDKETIPQEKQLQPWQSKLSPRKWWWPFGQVWTISLAIATLLGGPAAIVTFWPRMTVVPSGLSDESNPYSETFAVNNTGFLPLIDVRIGIGFCTFEAEVKELFLPQGSCDKNMQRFVVSAARWETNELKKDETFSITLTDALNVATQKYKDDNPYLAFSLQMLPALKKADAVMIILYRPWLSPWQRRSEFRFVAEEQPNGKLIWKSVPLSWHPEYVERN